MLGFFSKCPPLGSHGSESVKRTASTRLSAAFLLLSILWAFPPGSLATPSKMLLDNPDGFAEGALAEAEARARKWGMDVPHPAFTFDASKYEGAVAKRNALVILIDFEDNQGSLAKGNFENLLFSRGTYSTGSMRDFYLENSYGLLDVQGQVVGWVRSSRTYEYYHDFSAGLNLNPTTDRNARGMAEEALRLVDPFVDFSDFDNDGPDGVPSSGDDDGYVDALLIVHAGPGAEETGRPTDIRSHQSYFLDDQVYDGVRAALYTTEPENGKVGVFAHEFGHTLGLPDLYDLSGAGRGLGNWSLMGTGVWLDDGRTPAHLDAWSKVFLGFVEPLIPESNTPGVVLPPIEDEPAVYKVWTNGRPGSEYFLAERRERRGFDSYLPGEGMLVYHVDEAIRLQNDPNHYKVALEQADGLMQLEFGFGNAGDTGDPYPGATGNTLFGYNANPSSQAYDGSNTQVSLSGIREGVGATIFDVEVETRPEFVLAETVVEEVEGDGDGRVEPGERGAVRALVTNVGLGASGVQGVIEAINPAVVLESSTVSPGDVRADSSFSGDFTFSLDPGVDVDPIEMAFEMEITDAQARSWDIPFAVGGGEVFGFSDDFEGGGSWSHAPVTEGRADAWAITTQRARSGNFSWRFGSGPAYPNLADGALVSPPILLREGSQLAFFYWVRAESLGSSAAWDGGAVEISHKGGPWRELDPVGGYPFTVLEFGDTPLSGRGVFAGIRDWKRAVFDLSEYVGLARLRFRFVSDGSETREGWYIDDVAVTSRSYIASLAEIREVSNGVAVEVEVTELTGPFNGAGFEIYRKIDGGPAGATGGGAVAGFTLLNEEPLVPDAEGLVSYVDAGAQRGRAYLYLVKDLGPAPGGLISYLGPGMIYLCLGQSRASTRPVFPNPFVPGGDAVAGLSIALPDPECVREPVRVDVRIIDAAGRTVRRVPVGAVPSGLREVFWDGRDEDGELVPSGVYLWRVEVSGTVLGEKLVLIR
jgi:immune inhibitor A